MPVTRESYLQHRRRAAKRSAAMSAVGRDIGAIPPVRDPDRRHQALAGFRVFCEAYFPKKFSLAWSPDHLRTIRKIEQVVEHNLRFAIAMPRGSGKTTLCETAVIWAMLKGNHRFVFLVGATGELATAMLDNIKAEYEGNDLLLEDFPEVCYPIRCLEGEARRCAGQTHHGAKTHIGWGQSELILPTIPGSRCSGSLVRVAGITGNIRGQVHVTPAGESLRPTLAIVDDPQTDESSRSPSQCAARLATINGAIAGLAGPGKHMGIIVPCTVIQAGDLADTLLDREKSPEWRGERFKMVYKFPDRQDLWDQYAQILRQSLVEGGDGAEATEFYRQYREAMDAGAEVAWSQRYSDRELSAIEHAMKLRILKEEAFFAEYQNDPITTSLGDEFLTADQITRKVSGIGENVVPPDAQKLTAFIDVQKDLLYWVVVAWGPQFGGQVVAYGAYPDQKRRYFSYADAKRTLERAHPKAGPMGAIYAGLMEVTGQLLGRNWPGINGAAFRVERCLIDAGWGESTATVYRVCRDSPHAALLTPSFGRGLKAGDRPMGEWKRQPGEEVGHDWRRRPERDHGVRYVLYDTNTWKTVVHRALATPAGDPGSLMLYQADPEQHRMLAEHLTAESPQRTQGRGRELVEWAHVQKTRDNHLLDCLAGSAVAASMLGIALPGQEEKKRKKRRPATGDWAKSAA